MSEEGLALTYTVEELGKALRVLLHGRPLQCAMVVEYKKLIALRGILLALGAAGLRYHMPEQGEYPAMIAVTDPFDEGRMDFLRDMHVIQQRRDKRAAERAVASVAKRQHVAPDAQAEDEAVDDVPAPAAPASAPPVPDMPAARAAVARPGRRYVSYHTTVLFDDCLHELDANVLTQDTPDADDYILYACGAFMKHTREIRLFVHARNRNGRASTWRASVALDAFCSGIGIDVVSPAQTTMYTPPAAAVIAAMHLAQKMRGSGRRVARIITSSRWCDTDASVITSDPIFRAMCADRARDHVDVRYVELIFRKTVGHLVNTIDYAKLATDATWWTRAGPV